MSALIISIQHCIRGASQKISQENEIKGIKIGKKELISRWHDLAYKKVLRSQLKNN